MQFRSVKIFKIRVFLINVLKNETGGVALILVVWIMVVLIAIAGEFSYSMRTEINIARNFKEEEEAYQLALAGIEQAKLELLSVNTNEIVSLDKDNVLVFGKNEKEDEEKPARKDDLGNGSFKYVITDEDGKININIESLERLKYVFLETDIDSVEVDTIVDSIIDWRDPNDLHMLNGAEEDYYQSLEEPYSCKDGPFDSIEELLLVKGMKEEYLYGSKEEADEDEENVYEGVKKHLTVYGSGKININTASNLVLEAVFGVDTAGNIMSQRETGPILTPVLNGKVSSEIFTVISTGMNADGTIKRSVKMVVWKKDKDLETLYWNDNIIE
ncbi:MAG: general secretion pathway protein GspK [Nitrospirae bacterium]|nr:general secretion pathway protein GspK [Nitrospirota bacterium]